MQFEDEEFNESVQNRKRMVWIVLMTSPKKLIIRMIRCYID